MLHLGCKQELKFWHSFGCWLLKKHSKTNYIKCPMSPLSRLAGLMVDIIERVRDHERGNE